MGAFEELSKKVSGLYKKKKYQEAAAQCEQAVALAEREFGTDHLKVADTLLECANIYLDDSKFDAASERAEKALAVVEKSSGADSADSAWCRWHLGRIFFGAKQLEKSKSAFESALKIFEKSGRESDPRLSLTLEALSKVCHAMGDLDGAEKAALRCLEIERKDESNLPRMISLLSDLGAIASDGKNVVRAEQYYRESLALLEKIAGKEHPEAGWIRFILSQILKSQSKFQEAEQFCSETLEILQKTLGPDHPRTQWVQEKWDQLTWFK